MGRGDSDGNCRFLCNDKAKLLSALSLQKPDRLSVSWLRCNSHVFKSVSVDFIGAFKSNGMLLISLPFILFILAEMTVSYVNDGKLTNSKISGRIAVALIACFVVFGILRNLI